MDTEFQEKKYIKSLATKEELVHFLFLERKREKKNMHHRGAS